MSFHERITRVLQGAAPIDSLSPALQSAIRLPIYHQACRILNTPRQHQRAAIDALPDTIREAVRTECRRLYNQRRL